MIWIYVVIAISAVVGALMEFYVRFLPTRRENRAKNTEDKKIVAEELSRAIRQAQNYEIIEFQEHDVNFTPIGLGKVFSNACLSKKLLRELSQLKELADGYYEWFVESHYVVQAEIIAQLRFYPRLDYAVKNVTGSSLENRVNRPPSLSSMHKAIYTGDLTFEVAKEAVVQGLWDAKATIKDNSGKEEVVLFRDIIDIIEENDFHKLVEELQRLHERKSIKVLGDARAKFLEKAQLILIEVSNA